MSRTNTSLGTLGEWKPGLPPGKMTAENKQWFLDTYEVYFSPGGKKWYRERVRKND